MTIGVTLNDKHCYDDYGMWLTDVDIAQPEVQTHYVQVPGRNGELDLTEALTGDVRYYNGTTTMTFQTAEKVCGRSWFEQLELIRTDLHGQRAAFLFDGTNIEYSARCEVSGTPVAGGIYEITVTATVDAYEEVPPFAFYSADDNSLNFQCGHLPSVGDTYKGKTVTNLYDNVESTGTNPGWYAIASSVKSVKINTSFSAARPTSCNRWFASESNCTEIDGLANINTSEVANFYYMFRDCSLVKKLDVGGWDTSQATDMGYMFYGCSAVTSLNVSNFDTSNVTSFTYMFYGCSTVTALDVKRFDTSKATSMSNMFYGCSAVSGLQFDNWDTSNVTTLGYFMRDCASVTELDVSMLNTANVTNMNYTFYGCSSLVTIYSDDDVFVIDAVTSGGSMFSGCSSLVGGNGTVWASSNSSYRMAHVDTADSPGYFTDIKDK